MNASLSGKLNTTSAQARIGFGSGNNMVECGRRVFIIIIEGSIFGIVPENRLEPNSHCGPVKETVDSQMVLN